MPDPLIEAKKLRGTNPDRVRYSREDEAAWDLLGELVEEVERLRAELERKGVQGVSREWIAEQRHRCYLGIWPEPAVLLTALAAIDGGDVEYVCPRCREEAERHG